MSSSANRILKCLEDRLPTQEDHEELALMSDELYIRKSSALVTDALQKGYDVLHLPSGDIVITETRTVTFQYHWNDDKNKFERAKSGSRAKKTRKNSAHDNYDEQDDDMDLAS